MANVQYNCVIPIWLTVGVHMNMIEYNDAFNLITLEVLAKPEGIAMVE